MDRMKLDKIQPPVSATGSNHHPNSTTVSVSVPTPTVTATIVEEEDEDDDKESIKSVSLKNEDVAGLTASSQATNKRKKKSRFDLQSIDIWIIFEQRCIIQLK